MMLELLFIVSTLIVVIDLVVYRNRRQLALVEWFKTESQVSHDIALPKASEKLEPSGLVQMAQLGFGLCALLLLIRLLGIELFLVACVIAMGIAWGWGVVYVKRKASQVPETITPAPIEEQAKTFLQQARLFSAKNTVKTLKSTFWVLLLVVLFRSFIYDHYRIPSGSLEPTVKIGDFIAVNKFDYGLRLPVLHTKILAAAEPKRGDIVIFRYPPNPSIDYIKRTVGVPGDVISYVNKKLTINGKAIPQRYVGVGLDREVDEPPRHVIEMQEKLNGITYNIYIDPNDPPQNFRNIVVPKGYYFMMGDNRDDSADSRYWGFVPEKNIIGKATLVWMSWRGIEGHSPSALLHAIRWDRLFRRFGQ